MSLFVDMAGVCLRKSSSMSAPKCTSDVSKGLRDVHGSLSGCHRLDELPLRLPATPTPKACIGDQPGLAREGRVMEPGPCLAVSLGLGTPLKSASIGQFVMVSAASLRVEARLCSRCCCWEFVLLAAPCGVLFVDALMLKSISSPATMSASLVFTAAALSLATSDIGSLRNRPKWSVIPAKWRSLVPNTLFSLLWGTLSETY
jgi:hypothetical protein